MQHSFRQTRPLLHYAILAFMLGVGALTLASHTVLHALSSHEHERNHSHVSTETDDHCHGSPVHSYTITFTNKGVVPATLTLDRCDAVTIKNVSTSEVVPALGPHPGHIHYPGFEETELKPGEAYTFRGTKVGTFPMHDHDNYLYSATLTIR